MENFPRGTPTGYETAVQVALLLLIILTEISLMTLFLKVTLVCSIERKCYKYSIISPLYLQYFRVIRKSVVLFSVLLCRKTICCICKPNMIRPSFRSLLSLSARIDFIFKYNFKFMSTAVLWYYIIS